MLAQEKEAQFPVWQGGQLRCVARINETHDSATFVLSPDSPARFEYQPGQFITIGAEIAGTKHYRAYSISSSPSRSDGLAITIRRLPGGLVSNHLLDDFQVGARIEATAPAGEFFFPATAIEEKTLMLSAGSGVTPMMGMARWVLERRPDADIHFVYSARSEQDIIFRDELLALGQRHPNFRLDLFLDSAGGAANRHEGFLTPERLNALVSDAESRRIFLCGNQAYMQMIEGWHSARDLSADRFHRESFKPEVLAVAGDGGASVTLSMPAFGKTIRARAGQTLLEIMEPEGVPIIAACRSGVCGSCKCKVLEGEVERVSTATLTPEQIDEGMALACSTRVKSDLVVELVF